MAARIVKRKGEEVKLTATEYSLLRLFVQHAGKVLTHHQILREVWGPNYVEQTHYLRVYLAHLREKLEANPAQPELLITEPGVGYRLVCQGLDPSTVALRGARSPLATFGLRTSDFGLPICFSFNVLKFPSSQQATKVSVTDFNSSQRARICWDSFCVIWLSWAAAATTASKSANSCTISLVAGIR